MKILVTGGGGFLGAWVVRRLLARGAAIRVLDIHNDRTMAASIIGPEAESLDWMVGDVSDTKCVERAMADCSSVVHLAGLLTPACQNDPLKGAQVNVLGTLHIFEAAKKLKIPNVVYTSSVSVFGPNNGDTPHPCTHYGVFKLANEGCARAYLEYDGIRSVGIRPGVVYGPGREQGLTAGPTLACKAAVNGESYVIGYVGETCLVYVEDVAAAYEAAVMTPLDGAHVFNISGTPISTDVVIAEISKHYPNVEITAQGDKVPFTAHISDAQAYAAFPSLQRTDLAAGIRHTLDYYRRNR